MIIRKEIRSLTSDELLAFRRAMFEFQAKEGVDSYLDIAGYHGIPKTWCDHSAESFLAWHRIYLWKFESELRKIDNSVSVPFWDWTSDVNMNEGLAPAHSEIDFLDVDGQRKHNSLYSADIEDKSRKTRRNPNITKEKLESSARKVVNALQTKDFKKLNELLDDPHGDIHVLVGGSRGDMSSFARAGFDPIFWSHHANIDRQWAIWQKDNPDIVISDDVLNKNLNGFPGKKVVDVINHENGELNYTYEGLENQHFFLERMSSLKSLIEEGRQPEILLINDIERGGESFDVDIFIQNKDTNEETLAGSFGIFGAGDLQHLDHHGHGTSLLHSFKSTQHIDITDALKRLKVNKEEVEVKLKGINMKGDEVVQKDLPIGSISFQ